jgi:hypothetical protein
MNIYSCPKRCYEKPIVIVIAQNSLHNVDVTVFIRNCVAYLYRFRIVVCHSAEPYNREL